MDSIVEKSLMLILSRASIYLGISTHVLIMSYLIKEKQQGPVAIYLVLRTLEIPVRAVVTNHNINETYM